MRLETSRLALRSWTLNDAPAYARIVGDPDVMRHVGDGSEQSPRQAIEFIQRSIAAKARRGWIFWAVEFMENRELAGFCGYGLLDGQLDFGWRFARKFWGQGIGTEAARAALRFGIETCNFREIRSVAYTVNRGSTRIMEKLGMRQEGAGRRHGREAVHYFYRAGRPETRCDRRPDPDEDVAREGG